MSQKRMRTQSSAAQEPDNHKKQELDPSSIGQGGRSYDVDDFEAKPMNAKEREKLGVNVGVVVYCSYEITPLYPSFFRPEIVFTSPAEEDLVSSKREAETASPSPAPASRAKRGNHVDRLFICETCFKYTPDMSAYLAHANDRCLYVHAPPGKMLYMSPGLQHHPIRASVPHSNPQAKTGSVEPKYRETPGYALFEIDGDEDKLFCQNLSLFAKLWVESKSVGFDVGGFVFYVLVRIIPPRRPGRSQSRRASSSMPEIEKVELEKEQEPKQTEDNLEHWGSGGEEDEEDDSPNRIVGYFSKEKNSWDSNNLACILVFPPWQGKGIGQLLIEASYYLGKREGRFGGPERPLSDSGKKSYEAYWSHAVGESLLKLSEEDKPTIKDVADHAWIVPDDVISTLERMQWAEGFISHGDKINAGDTEQKLVINRRKIGEYLQSKRAPEGLEEEGWMISEETSSDEEGSDSDMEDDDSEDDENEDLDEEVDEDTDADPRTSVF